MGRNWEWGASQAGCWVPAVTVGMGWQYPNSGKKARAYLSYSDPRQATELQQDSCKMDRGTHVKSNSCFAKKNSGKV